MRITVIGGGPAGLAAAISIKHIVGGSADVTIFDRNGRRQDGFGLILSPRTVARYATRGFRWAAALSPELASWTELAVVAGPGPVRISGHPARAIPRAKLIAAMRDEAQQFGCRVIDGQGVDEEQAGAGADLVVDARGAGHERLTLSGLSMGQEANQAHFAWYATDRRFDCLTFVFADSGDGILTAHAYPYAPDRSAFIVEGPAKAWRAVLAQHAEEAPSEAQSGAGTPADGARLRTAVQASFVDVLDGHRLYGMPSQLRSFQVRSAAHWRTGSRILIGDAAHSAHFSVGSGTTMALDDALALAEQLRDARNPTEGMDAYAALRRPETTRVQELGRRSSAWWSSLAARWPVLSEPELAWSLATRTGQGTASRLRAHDAALHATLVRRARQRCCGSGSSRVWRFPEDGAILRQPDLGSSFDVQLGQLDGITRARLVDLLERIAEPGVLRGRQAVGLRVDPADEDWAEAQRLAGRVNFVTGRTGQGDR